MAAFGLPGGGELCVIGLSLLLFVPGLLFGVLGYLLGRRHATAERAALSDAGAGRAEGDPTADAREETHD